ncbi:chaperone TorD involved in molybdoenzyme TorA maturation [Loktanella sp. DSM 29012]|uniref:TorD/DmsD family molecular chaperone n=1 Tax=Loktanella sp. DSM 29012 TaxID=1881056 RepID=UPI0008C9263D|nr:molecular chaperone TorD family protein [Loktanella sp. DSM 29012]SEP92744.1 chaperone TorD involved in molybdoenzyme TorA maturation [Loktanella sp. DSM 29012]
MTDLSAEDRLRADLYNFLGLILSGPPDQLLLDQTAQLSGDETALGTAINGLAAAARKGKPKDVSREYNALFIGLGRGELLPYASYYLTGFLNEKPLARLRRDMMDLRIVRAANVFEPEDNAASLMEMMGGMIVGRFGAPVSLAAQKDFYAKHVGPWAGHFYGDLRKAKSAELYTHVGAVGAAFMTIEKEAFRLAA